MTQPSPSNNSALQQSSLRFPEQSPAKKFRQSSELSSNKQKLPKSDKPWSHRQTYAIRLLISFGAGLGVGIIGTLAHRMGALHNIPYGLVLALLVVAVSAWCARSRAGVVGLGMHLISSSGIAWLIATGWPNGSALVPIGFGGSVPYFSEHVGYIWLIGIIIVQCLMVFFPISWFRVTSKRSNGDEQLGLSQAHELMHDAVTMIRDTNIDVKGNSIDTKGDDMNVDLTNADSSIEDLAKVDMVNDGATDNIDVASGASDTNNANDTSDISMTTQPPSQGAA